MRCVNIILYCRSVLTYIPDSHVHMVSQKSPLPTSTMVPLPSFLRPQASTLHRHEDTSHSTHRSPDGDGIGMIENLAVFVVTAVAQHNSRPLSWIAHFGHQAATRPVLLVKRLRRANAQALFGDFLLEHGHTRSSCTQDNRTTRGLHLSIY